MLTRRAWNLRCCLTLSLLGSVALIGCGSGHPQTTAVTGTVTYGGKPVAGAHVMFTPEGGRPAEATTDAAGKFKLTTFSPGDGALPGKHRVMVSKVVTQPSPDPSKNPYGTSKNELPARYASPQSPLQHEVTAKGPNDFQLELTDG
ncbi:MAG TPA: carboxypeptidase-like regulatory domain-containing protein [Pirellulaceae bacterium]|nr:carboxypeptidase-like regulatory domain-containing protein [Pirellulaceae bacterium]